MLLFGGSWSDCPYIFKPKHCSNELGALSFWRPWVPASTHTQPLCLTYTQLKHLHHLSGNGNLMGSMVISTPESRSEHVVNDMRWNYADRIHSDKHKTFLEARKSLPIPRLPKYRGPKSRGSLSKRQCIWETSWDGWDAFVTIKVSRAIPPVRAVVFISFDRRETPSGPFMISAVSMYLQVLQRSIQVPWKACLVLLGHHEQIIIHARTAGRDLVGGSWCRLSISHPEVD